MEFATDKLYDESGKLDRNFSGHLTVCFIGGSLTEGGREWLYMVQRYFKDYFPKAEVEAYNLGLGGTGSVAGAARFDEEVSVHDPDIVFIEFTINDGTGEPTERCAATEMMFRRCMSLGKIPAVIYLHTVSPRNPDSEAYFTHRKAIGIKEALACHYGIPTVCIYDYFVKKYRHDRMPGDSFEEFLIHAGYYRQNKEGYPDIHPPAVGYHLYGEAILEAFETYGLAHFLRRLRTDEPYYSSADRITEVEARYRYRYVADDKMAVSAVSGITYGTGWKLIDEHTSGIGHILDNGEYIGLSRMNGMMYADDRQHPLVRNDGDTSAITDRGASLTFTTEADAILVMFRSIFYNKAVQYFEKIDGKWTLLMRTEPTSVNSREDGGGQTFFDKTVRLSAENTEHEIMIVIAANADGSKTMTDASGEAPMQGDSAYAPITNVAGYSFRFGLIAEKYLGK